MGCGRGGGKIAQPLVTFAVRRRRPYILENAKLAYTDSLLEKYRKLWSLNALHDR